MLPAQQSSRGSLRPRCWQTGAAGFQNTDPTVPENKRICNLMTAWRNIPSPIRHRLATGQSSFEPSRRIPRMRGQCQSRRATWSMRKAKKQNPVARDSQVHAQYRSPDILPYSISPTSAGSKIAFFESSLGLPACLLCVRLHVNMPKNLAVPQVQHSQARIRQFGSPSLCMPIRDQDSNALAARDDRVDAGTQRCRARFAIGLL